MGSHHVEHFGHDWLWLADGKTADCATRHFGRGDELRAFNPEIGFHASLNDSKQSVTALVAIASLVLGNRSVEPAMRSFHRGVYRFALCREPDQMIEGHHDRGAISQLQPDRFFRR